ncbi:hypothetical protein LGH70_20965, partial [Hymenobacter sp. BT635]|nr:hypothetical protein [Hymenobacter nitidus]
PLAQWQSLAAWPRPHQPVALRLVSAAPVSSSPVVSGPQSAPGVRLALRQDAQLPEWQTGYFWPSLPGWHFISRDKQPAQTFYVFAPQQWSRIEQELRLQAAQPWQVKTAVRPIANPIRTSQAYPATWFFLVFLLAAGLLWLEEKL